MQRLSPRAAGRLALLTCAAALLAGPAAAEARSLTAELRVHGPSRTLAPGYSYVTGPSRLQTDRTPGCDGSGKVVSLPRPSALGLVESASRISRAVRPLSVSDKFSFGLFVCGIGGFFGDDTRFWLYKVNHVAPEVGADQFALQRGARVLWYFQDTARRTNTGDELELSAPARARSGQAFEVTVYGYDSHGNRHPVPGALVRGPTVQRTDAAGRARIFSDKRGYLRLRAVHGSDIPAKPLKVCLAVRLRQCPARRGQRIFGTNGADRIRGTGGADVIRARGGNDRIDVLRGGRDRVRCGRGFDRVLAGRGDLLGRDCERVRRR
jgi:hypothetical protein